MPNNTWPDWEQVLSAAARLQHIPPEAVLVGGTASALYAEHRLSTDANHVLPDLRPLLRLPLHYVQGFGSGQGFDQVLAELESVAGWKTARVKRPVEILGSLDGIETGVRQLIRDEPLETTQIERFGQKITIPTQAEILRIKGVLILKRSTTRITTDCTEVGECHSVYPCQNPCCALQQLQIQLANPLPYDLEELGLAEYKNLDPRWQNWETVKAACAGFATLIFDRIVGLDG